MVFGLPEGVDPAGPVEDGETFKLYENYASVNEQPYNQSVQYVVRFPQSVRGLRPGAPVEYRGIRLGWVERVLIKEMAAKGFSGEGDPIPVLIRLEPGRLELPDSEEGTAALARAIDAGVGNGLRATLSTGNLLTGSLYVYFDRYPDEPPAEIGSFAGYPTIPTIASGFEGIQVRLSALLDKLNALPLGELLDRVDQLLADVDAIVASEDMQSLPASLEETLAQLRDTLDSVSADSAMQERLMRTVTELDRTLQSLRALLDTLKEKPNALIFSSEPGKDPQPPAGSP